MKKRARLVWCLAICALCFAGCISPEDSGDVMEVKLEYPRDYCAPTSVPFAGEGQKAYLDGHRDGWLDVARQNRGLYKREIGEGKRSVLEQGFVPIYTRVEWPHGGGARPDPYRQGYREGQYDGLHQFVESNGVVSTGWGASFLGGRQEGGISNGAVTEGNQVDTNVLSSGQDGVKP